MKSLMKTSLLVLLSLMVFFGCEDNAEEPANEILIDYLIDNDMDLPAILDGWITTASDVYTKMTDADATNDYYIMDIRDAADYNAGHVEGAVNVALADVVTAAENAAGKTIVVFCYSGQSAGHAVVALRLSGYPDAKVSKFGMCAWNSATAGSWNNNTGNAAEGNTNWVEPGNIDLATDMAYEYPDLGETDMDGDEILAERVEALLAGFNGVANSAVLGTPGDYFINNYWTLADVETYGHISGAHRMVNSATPVEAFSLAGDEIMNLDPEKSVVTYCWTGQTSSIVTAYLTVLGYDALSLKFGANGMIYDNLTGHKWSAGAIMDYPLTTGN